jgi:hypothetical protein
VCAGDEIVTCDGFIPGHRERQEFTRITAGARQTDISPENLRAIRSRDKAMGPLRSAETQSIRLGSPLRAAFVVPNFAIPSQEC